MRFLLLILCTGLLFGCKSSPHTMPILQIKAGGETIGEVRLLKATSFYLCPGTTLVDNHNGRLTAKGGALSVTASNGQTITITADEIEFPGTVKK